MLVKDTPWRRGYAIIADVLPIPTSYKRKRSKRYGDDEASYVTRTSIHNAMRYMRNYLGQELSEDTLYGFKGFIDNITVEHKGIKVTRGYENITTAVYTKFDELIANGDFETGNFNNWSTAGDVSLDSTSKVKNTYSAKLNYVTTWPELYQSVTVLPNETYRLSFQWQNDTGTTYLNWRIYDNTNAADIFALAAVETNTTNNPKRFEIDFTTPSNCVSIQIKFAQQSGTAGISYVDDVSVRKLDRDKTVPTYTGPSTSNMGMWGRIESVLDCGDAPPATADQLRFTHLSEYKNPTQTTTALRHTATEDQSALVTIHASGYSHTAKWKLLLDRTDAEEVLLKTAIESVCSLLDYITVTVDISYAYNTKIESRAAEKTVDQALDTLLPANARWQRSDPFSSTAYTIDQLSKPTDIIYRKNGHYYSSIGSSVPINPYAAPSAFYIKELDSPLDDALVPSHIVDHNGTLTPAN